MKLSEELQARGFINQFSAETLEEIVDGPPRVVYLGIDPTADAIHVGHLVPFMLLNHLLRAGHLVYLLVGGGTALIGDPGGRDTERPLIAPEEVAANAQSLEAAVKQIAVADIRFVNNYDWLSNLTALEFLRDVGKYFTVNTMVKKEAVATRMQGEHGISYTEFSYALLQSYDYWYLHTTHGCDLQIGGSDQWGNLVSGVDYIRRTTGNTVYALTMALITDRVTGKKFGKSMGNAIWLDPKKTSPYQLYQFWLQTNDESVFDYLKLFTFLSLAEITTIEAEHKQAPEQRMAQQRLADEVVRFVYGEEVAKTVCQVSAVLFGASDVGALKDEELAVLREEAPYLKTTPDTKLTTILVESALASSKREARTFIADGAILVGDTKVGADVELSEFKQSLIVVRRGKRQSVLVEIG